MSITAREVCAALAGSQTQVARAELRAYALRHGQAAQATRTSAQQARRAHEVVAELCAAHLTRFEAANDEGVPNAVA